jgi:TP901 family phage tail tape measure protein
VAKGGSGGAVEQLFVELGLDPSKFFSGVDSAVTQGGQKAEAFGKKSSAVMSGIAAAAAVAGAAVISIFSVKTIKDAINYTEEYAGEVRKLARETGMSTEESSDMIFAFHHVGLEASDASRSLGILAKKLKGVQDEETGVTTGGKSTAAILADIGIIATDAEGNLRPMGDLIPEIADAFKGLPDGVEKTGLAMQIFGRSGKDMIPMLNLGSEGIKELSAEAKKLGLELSAENAEKIKQYSYAHRTLTAAVGGLKLVIGVALIPVLTKALNWLTKLQPAVREGLGKAVEWLGKAFGTLGKYIKAVTKTGEAWNDALDGLPAPLKLLIYLIGETILRLKDIGEWLLKAGATLVDWGRKVAGFLPSGKGLGDHFDLMKRVVPLVADAIAALLAVMTVNVVLSFALAMGKVALQFLTFPIREAQAAATAVGNFVSAVASMVSKAVTITQNVVTSGAELIRSLPWVTQEITQLVSRKLVDPTKAWISDFSAKTQEITQVVTQKVTVPVQKAAVGRDLGMKLAQGIAQGLGAGLAGLISILIAGIATGAIVISTPVWIAIGVAIATVVIAGVGWAFRDQLAAFFTGPFPRFFTEALPQFAKALPGWAGQLAGMIAAAVVFALIGVPALIIEGLVKGFQAAAPAVGKAVAGAFTGAGKAISGVLGKVPWGTIGKQMSDWMTGKTELKLLTKAWEGLGDALGKIPWDAIGKFIEGWSSGRTELALFRKALDLVADGFRELPGAIASIPGLIANLGRAFLEFARNVPKWIGDAFGAIPGIAKAALTGAGGLVGIVTGAMGDMLGAIAATPVGRFIGDLMGQVWDGFQTGWNRVNELTGGALNDLVSSVSGLPGRLIGFVADLLGAGADLGGAIVDGIISGIKAGPEVLAGLGGAFVGLFRKAANTVINAINDAIPNHIGWGPLGFDIPPNPVPTIPEFAGGGIVPGPMGAPVLAIVHGGEHITEPGPAPIFNFNMPLTMTGYDLEGMRRLIHAEIDIAFNGAARQAYLAGAPLRGGIG